MIVRAISDGPLAKDQMKLARKIVKDARGRLVPLRAKVPGQLERRQVVGKTKAFEAIAGHFYANEQDVTELRLDRDDR